MPETGRIYDSRFLDEPSDQRSSARVNGSRLFMTQDEKRNTYGSRLRVKGARL